jgi:hypothetical protein
MEEALACSYRLKKSDQEGINWAITLKGDTTLIGVAGFL